MIVSNAEAGRGRAMVCPKVGCEASDWAIGGGTLTASCIPGIPLMGAEPSPAFSRVCSTIRSIISAEGPRWKPKRAIGVL